MALNAITLNGHTVHGRTSQSAWDRLIAIADGDQVPVTDGVAARGAIAQSARIHRHYEEEDQHEAPEYHEKDQYLTIKTVHQGQENRFYRVVSFEKSPTIKLSAINTNVAKIDLKNIRITK